jgi:hypothetical protein
MDELGLMEKALIKYDGIEFSLPLAVTDNPTFNIS